MQVSLYNHRIMKKLLLLLLLLPFYLTSCVKSKAVSLMNDIETYIQTRPDSALTVLSQIDTSSLRHPKERAQFALLYAIALDKNYVDTTDIRVIRPAVDYYPKHGTAWQKMLTYYYEGRILFNAKRDAEAIISQMHADLYSNGRPFRPIILLGRSRKLSDPCATSIP